MFTSVTQYTCSEHLFPVNMVDNIGSQLDRISNDLGGRALSMSVRLYLVELIKIGEMWVTPSLGWDSRVNKEEKTNPVHH